MAAVTPEEFAGYIQQDVDTYTTVLLLSLAEGLVVDAIGELPEPAPYAVKAVILEAARRAYVNPLGWSSEQFSIDDYSENNRRDTASRAGVYLTDAEIASISPRLSGAFTIYPSLAV